MEKGSNFLQNMHFGVKNQFSGIRKFSESSGLILLASLAFWKLLISTSCSTYLEMILKGRTDFYFGKFNFQC